MIIGAIAAQTNLNSNATIEAARAGSRPRLQRSGPEVKALAGQTGKATQEIATLIAAMQARPTVPSGRSEGISARSGNSTTFRPHRGSGRGASRDARDIAGGVRAAAGGVGR